MKDWLSHHNCRWLDLVLIKKFNTERILHLMNHDSIQGVRA